MARRRWGEPAKKPEPDAQDAKPGRSGMGESTSSTAIRLIAEKLSNIECEKVTINA
jgi:hypothetical protein